jgi:acyl-CoA synthetase (AMP-forming)/AMP-acid ligase II
MTTFEGPPLEQAAGIGARTFGAFVDQLADRHGSSEAIAFDDPLRDGLTVRWSYVDLRDAARGVALGLLRSGVLPGDSVAVLMGNRPEAVAAILGIGMVGGVAVPMSTFAKTDELVAMLQLAKVSAVLTQSSLLGRRLGDEVEALRPSLPNLGFVATVGEPSWSALLAGGDTVPGPVLDERRAAVGPGTPGLVIFSSGTTAVPKGMLHTHGGTTLQFWQLARVHGRHPGTRLWSAFPIFWTAGLNTAVGSTLAAGGCWVAQETFDAGAALALLARERVTEPYALPHQIGAMAEHPDWEATDLSSLRCVFGTSAFARHPSVQGDPGWTFPVGYGMSETGATFATHPSSAPRAAMRASSGRLLAGNQLRVLDPDTGRPLGPDQEGELAVKGPSLMLRYLGRDPSACFDEDGFFHTGDTGYVDGLGEVHFTGRRTEMIKTGGANVAPAELEVQLRACTPVKLARIVGVPDERLGEAVVACVVLKDGASATESDIQDFLRSRVASFKVPRRVLFFEDGEIPLTSGGTKVRDDALDALVKTRLADALPTSSGDR